MNEVASLLSESRTFHAAYRTASNARGADKMTPLIWAAQKRKAALGLDPEMTDAAWVETMPRATHDDLVEFYKSKGVWE